MERKSSQEIKQSKIKKQSARAVMNQKTTNSIKLVNKQPKLRAPKENPLKPTYEDTYMNMLTFQMTPMKKDFLRSLALEWIEDTKVNEVLLLNEFQVTRGIPQTTWSQWIEKSPELKEASNTVRQIIAIRREKGAMQSKYNTLMVNKMQHVYDKAWKDAEEWRASLTKQNEAVAQQPIQVILERYPDSPMVPVKKVSE